MSKSSTNNKPFEQLHYPTLFEWEFLNNCSENNLLECAKFLCQTIIKFNGISRAYNALLTEKKQFENNILKLTEHCKYLENCKNCTKLQKKLNDQGTVMKTLANIFGQISTENAAVNISSTSKNSLEKAHNIFTQLLVDNPDDIPQDTDANAVKSAPRISRKIKSRNSPDVSDSDILKECAATFMTPKKRLKISSIISPKEAFVDVNVEADSMTSPILGKAKIRSYESRTTSIVRSEDITATINECLPEVKEATEDVPVKIYTSPSLLKSTNSSDEKIPISKPETSNSPAVVLSEKKIDRIKRHSISLLQELNVAVKDDSKADATKRKKIAKCKAMKQSRLSFSKAKQKLPPLDISMAQNFFGGIRSTSTEYIDDDAMLKAGMQASLEISKININDELRLSQQDDDDVINASPSYAHQPVIKWPKMKHKIKKENIEPQNKMDISEDATMMFAAEHRPVKEEVLSEPFDGDMSDLTLLPTTRCHGNTTPQPAESSNPEIGAILKIPSPEIMYKEQPIRKKADKKKLPGWSCAKCKEFYEVAFAGNEEMIRQKMEECSRHRGKFNPERRCTPPGFWDLKMPCTEDTEAFNRRNNGD